MTSAADNELERPWRRLLELLEGPDPEPVRAFFAELAAGDAPRIVARLDESTRERLFAILDAEQAADIFEQMPTAQATRVIEELPPDAAAAVLDELQSDEQADLLSALDEECAQSILAEMPREKAIDAERLASYPSDVAGGLMVTELITFNATMTVDEVLNSLRSRADELEDYEVQDAYVTDNAGQLQGVLRMRDLLFAQGRRSVRACMLSDPLSVDVSTPLLELEHFFDSHAFLGVPVVDDGSQLVGIVHRDDVEAARGDRSTQDHLKSQGIVGGDELRSMPTLLRARRRLSWLSVNILLNVAAASVIAVYQDTLASVIALAVFLPMISDMSGCSGNQAVAVSMRELTLGLIRPADAAWVWMKEVGVGVVNGLALGLLLGTVAWLWKDNAYLGVVVGSALAVNTVVAVSLGGLIPLVLKRLDLDPALASGPILTTITDMCGFLLVLVTATALLEHLVV